LRETPQSITVITRQQMDDFGLNTVNEALQSTSSVYVNKLEGGSGYASRGFSLQIQYDGMAAPTGLGSVATASPDSAFLDHVEIQQGAAGLLTGAGEPGGTISMVRKRPTETFQAQAELGLGAWERRRLVGDVSGPLTQSGVIRGRAVVVSDDSDSYIDYTFSDKKGFYGVIEALPTANTKIGFSLQYQKNRLNEPRGGVPTAPDGSDLGWSRSTFFGDPDGRVKEENTQASLYWEQQLSENWLLRANYSHSTGKADTIYGSQVGALDLATGDGLRAVGLHSRRKTSGDVLETYVQGTGNLFGRSHEFALGFNGSKIKSWVDANVAVVPFNIYTYHPSMTPHVNTHVALGDPEKTQQYGLWGVARLNLADSLKLIVGTRVSWYGYWDTTGVQTMEENSVLSPYAGIVYDLNKQISVYASYSDIFKPQSDKDRTGNVLEPVVGSNYEIGIKGEFFNKRLNAAAAVFRLEQTNLSAMDEEFGISPVCADAYGDWYCYIAQGKVISEGVDLSLNGALSSNWNIGAGYTYLRSEYGAGEQKGDRYEARIPAHTFRLSSTYRIPGSNWTVGGNLRAQSSTYRVYNGGGGDAKIEQSGFTLLGLMAKYQINQQAEFNITANNVFDKRYRYPNTTTASQYGEPRSVFASLRYRF
jgi:outer membrane receptor for ferric coprogen and ferric-rhodotorulic acid